MRKFKFDDDRYPMLDWAPNPSNKEVWGISASIPKSIVDAAIEVANSMDGFFRKPWVVLTPKERERICVCIRKAQMELIDEGETLTDA